MPDDACRLAKLEEGLSNIKDEFRTHRAEEETTLTDILNSLRKIESVQAGQKGFIAGITFAVSSIFAVAIYFLGKNN